MAREQPTIAFLGPKTSYTSQMARKVFPDSDFLHIPKPTIEAVFEAVQSGVVDRGVVPIENSSNGPVIETVDLLADIEGRFEDVSVSGAASLKVNHCLLGFPSRALPSTPPASPPGYGESSPLPLVWPTSQESVEHIKQVYSHTQAFGQCKSFLSKYLPNATLHEVTSTSAAALAAMQDPSRTSAALASAVIIKDPRFPLSILAERVQDAADNTTRFLVLKRVTSLRYRSSPAAWANELYQNCSGGRRGVLISFTGKSSSGKQLAEILNIFQRHDLDTRLVAIRPHSKQAWQNQYHIELVSRSRGDSTSSVQPEELDLKDFEKMVQSWKVLGAWGSSVGWQ